MLSSEVILGWQIIFAELKSEERLESNSTSELKFIEAFYDFLFHFFATWYFGRGENNSRKELIMLL